MVKKNDRLILVAGASGQQGGAVLRHLREKNFPIRALTRDTTGAKARALMTPGVELATGDLENPASLVRALDGVYGVYSVQAFTSDSESEIRQGNNLIDAATRAGVRQFVYSSVVSADKTPAFPISRAKAKLKNTFGQQVSRTPFFVRHS